MLSYKMILSAIIAAGLSTGAAMAEKPVLTADQIAKFEALKAKIEAARSEHKADHDSLKTQCKGDIEARIGEHRGSKPAPTDAQKAEWAARKAALEAKLAKFKANHPDSGKVDFKPVHPDSGMGGGLTPEQIAALKAKLGSK